MAADPLAEYLIHQQRMAAEMARHAGASRPRPHPRRNPRRWSDLLRRRGDQA